jgi:hypothetical protein
LSLLLFLPLQLLLLLRPSSIPCTGRSGHRVRSDPNPKNPAHFAFFRPPKNNGRPAWFMRPGLIATPPQLSFKNSPPAVAANSLTCQHARRPGSPRTGLRPWGGSAANSLTCCLSSRLRQRLLQIGDQVFLILDPH